VTGVSAPAATIEKSFHSLKCSPVALLSMPIAPSTV